MLSLSNKKWRMLQPSQLMVGALVKDLNISPLVALLLVNRKITSPDDARYFIASDLADLPNPFLMMGMQKAVDRIVCAIGAGESITVFGDYDVDGVTAA